MSAPAPSFDAIYREFHPKVLRYMTGVAGAAEAPDLAQTALMKVAQHLPEFRGEAALATWIYRIAANVALDRLRQRAGDLPVAADAGEDEEGEDEAVPEALRSPSTEAAAERREMSACVREFVDRLPVAYRNVLVLGEIEGFSNAEIAQITGLSLETVKIRLHRGRARLRAELEKGCTLGRDAGNELACERAAPIRFK
ncbi:MAG: RNA polymerase sigma factor [Betaproteobacteria bacterium]